MSVLVHYPILLLLAGGFALSVFVLVSQQPLGRPRPDPVTRIRRLDPDLVWDEADTVGTASSLAGLQHGRIAAAWDLDDRLSALQQLGLLPATREAAPSPAGAARRGS